LQGIPEGGILEGATPPYETIPEGGGEDKRILEGGG